MAFKNLRNLLSSSPKKSNKERARVRKKPFRLKPQLCLEGLEERMVLSAPAPYSLGNVTVPATSQGGQVSGSYFLGGSFNTGDKSVGGISSTPVGQFGAKLNLNLSGQVGVNLGYSASTGGQVDSTYQGVSLQQNYSEPTQFNQQVNFTSQNTNVSYQSGSFSTTGPSVSASASLVANVSGSVGGTFAFFKSVSGSSNFSTNINQPLFNVAIGSTGNSNGNDLGLTLGVLGTDLSSEVNDLVSSGSLSVDVNPAGPEIPIYISGSVNGSTSPIGLHESLSLGVGEGDGDEAVGGSVQLGSADQYVPDITLNSNRLQNGGVLTDSEQGNLADLNIQAGPVVAALLSEAGIPGGAVAALAGADSFSIGPASVTFTPVSFQVGPNLTIAQTSTITPTSQLTYTFTNSSGQAINVDVTKNGQDLGLVHSVTFSPGVDNLSVKFAGTPITVTPSWTFTEKYNEELDLDVSFQGSLTAGSLSASFGDFGTPTLGPLYSQNFDFADYKIATLYNNTSTIKTTTTTLPSFIIGSSFSPSLNVTQLSDSAAPGSLRGAVESADLTNSSSPQIIHLGPGTYNLTISPNASGPGSSGGLLVTAPNVIIEGAGAGQTIINASGLGDRVFDVASGANLSLDGVTVTGGSVGFTAVGGGIRNRGTLTVSNSSITNNSSNDGGGGGIANLGTLTVIDSEIASNITANIGVGNLSLGGGIYNQGSATIINSTIDNNLALDNGGGIYNVLGNVTLINSTVEGNETASDGGGIANISDLTVVNSTIYANSANDTGGGIFAAQFSFNSLTNTIVAGNEAITPNDIAGVLDGSSANNLIGDGIGVSGISNGNRGNMVGQPNALIDPKLAPLGNYGGPTPTLALLSGSPAIAAGTSTVPGGLPPTDQRGFARTANGKVDIGAVEYQYDLAVTGYITPGPMADTAEYVYFVTNNGPDPILGAKLTAPLAQGTTFLLAPLVTSGWAAVVPGAGQNGTATFTDSSALNPGQNAEFVLLVHLQNTAVGAILANTATVGQSVSDTTPQNNSLTLTVANEQEGQIFKNVLLHFTDPNPNIAASIFTASVFWGDGGSNSTDDGTGKFLVVANPNGGYDVVGTHAFAHVGEDELILSVSGLDGTLYNSITQQLFVVADAPLTAGALTPPPFPTINQPISNALLFHFTDADPNGAISDYTATVTWGDDTKSNSDDGSDAVSVIANPNGGFDVIGSHTYTKVVNAGTFSVQVSDVSGSSTGATDSNFQVQAADQPLTAGALNVPNVTIEGQSVKNQLLFQFSDPDLDAQGSDYLATVFWGDGEANSSNDGSGTVSIVADPNGGFDILGTHTYVATSGADFGVKITDLGDPRSSTPDLGGQVTGAVSSTPLTIINPPVVVTAGQTYTAMVNEPSAVQTVATFTDPGGPGTDALSSPYIATIQWGDGTVTVASSIAQADYINATVDSKGHTTGQLSFAESVGGIVLGSDGQTFSVNLAHEYANQGSYTVTILLNHQGVLSPTVTITALVAGIDNLTATGSAPITSTFGAGISNATVATFTDTNTVTTASNFMATILWGDGQSSAGVISGANGNFTVAGNHNYAVVGNYQIGVIINGFAGTATATASTSATINPAAPTLSISDAGGTYTGNPFPATATALGVDGKTPVAGNFIFTYNGVSGAPVNAGTYQVVATFVSSDPNYISGDTAQTTSTIAPAAPTLSVTDAGGVYNGKSMPATGTALGADGKTPVAGSFTYVYYAGSSASGTPLSGAPINAGAYTVVATFTNSDSNYTGGGAAQTTFTISQAKISYTIGNDAQAFGHPANLAADLPPTFGTGINGETLDITYSSSGDTSTASAGVYAITGVVSNGTGSTSNYIVTLTNGSLTVQAAGVSVVGTELWIVGGLTSNDNVQINPVGASATGSTGVRVQATLNGVNTSTIFSQSFTAINIIMYAGNDNIQLAPTLTINAKLSAGNGNDNVQLDAGNNTVTLGNGNDNVQAGNGNNTVTLGNGNDNINAGNGNNTITAGNGNDNLSLGYGNNVVTLGTGNENINAGNGNNTIIAGNGNDNLSLGYGNNLVTLGNGNDNVNAGLGNNTVTLGNGNDNVSLGNGANTVTVGSGNDNINAGNGNNVIVEGNGNDNISAGNGDNLVVAGLGQHNINVGNGSDILIDGSVQLTQSGDTLGQVLADWIQHGNQAANVASIRSRLHVTFNTNHANNLNAGGGLDWFWATYAADHLNANSADLRN